MTVNEMNQMNQLAHRLAVQARRGEIHALDACGVTARIILKVEYNCASEWRYVTLGPGAHKREKHAATQDEARAMFERDVFGADEGEGEAA